MADRAALIAELEEADRLGAPEKAASQQRQQYLDELYGMEMNRIESEEQKFLKQVDIETKLGGELVYGHEIPGFWLQRGIAVREELPRAVAYADKSGEIPDGARAYGVQTEGGENIVAYKFEDDNKFYAINDPGFSLGDIGKYGGALVSAETLTGGVAEMLMPWKRVTGPANVLYKLAQPAARVGIAAVAAGAGRGVDEVTEAISDEEMQTLGAISDKMVESGIWGAGGHMFLSEPYEVIAGKLSKHSYSMRDLWRMSKKGATPDEAAEMADVLDMNSKELTDLFRAIAREDLDVLGMGELGHPIAKRAQAQAAGVSGEAARREKSKLSTPARRLIESRYNVNDVADLDDTALETVVNQQEEEAKALLKKSFSEKGVDFNDKKPEIAGKSAAETVLDYRKVTQEKATRLYDDVFDLAERQGIDFDISEAIKVARIETAPRTLTGRPREVTDRYFDLDSPSPVTETKTITSDVEIPPPVEGRLQEILGRLQGAADIQGAEKLGALRQIRSDLLKMAEPDPNRITSTPSEAAATRVQRALTESINGTQNTGDSTYRAAVKAANDHWKARSANLDAFGYMANLNTTGAGERIYRRIFSADLTEEEAKFLISHMTPLRKSEFRSALYTDMMRNPDKINSTLRQMDRAGEHLVPENARAVLKQYRREIEKSNKSLVARLLTEQGEQGARVSVLINKGDAKDIRALIKSGAMTEQDVSRSVVMDFIQHTTDFDGARPIINRAKYETKIKQYGDKGILGLLEPRAREMLTNIRIYNSFLPKGLDSGDSIAAAAIASDVLKVGQNPMGAAKAGLRIYQLTIAARLAHSPAILQILKGKTTGMLHPKARAFLLAGTIEVRKLNQGKEE